MGPNRRLGPRLRRRKIISGLALASPLALGQQVALIPDSRLVAAE